MKSEERHQLLTNDLGVVTTKTAGFLERHSGTTIAVACGTLLVAAIGFWWTAGSVADNSAGWALLDSAKNIDDFGNIVDKFKGKPPAQWAQLQIAEKNLQSALPLMFSNRELALTDLKSAREGFDALVQDKTVQSTIRERSLWGLALCLESGCDGDTSKPIAAFNHLLEEFPSSIFKPVAEQRLAALKQKDAADFYAWFSKETPKPPEVRPRDFKTDGVELPAPANPADEKDDDTEKAPASPKAEEKEEKTPAATDPAPATPEPAKPVEGEKTNATDAPKADDKPIEKN